MSNGPDPIKPYRNYVIIFALNVAILAGVLALLRREAPRPVVVTQPTPRIVETAPPIVTPAQPTLEVKPLVGSATPEAQSISVPADEKVDLNTATQEQLEALPRIGPTLAQRILDYREEKGGFGSVQELLEVRGIGEGILRELEPLVTVR
jgi:competence protein ComEA